MTTIAGRIRQLPPRFIGCRFINANGKNCLQRERARIHAPCTGENCISKRKRRGELHVHHTFASPRGRNADLRLRTTVFLSASDREFLASWGGSFSVGTHRMIMIVRALEEASDSGLVPKVKRPEPGGVPFEEEEIVT